MKQTARSIFALIMTLIFITPLVSTGGDTWFVAPNGSDGNSGLGWSTPLASIGEAVSRAQDGDLVLVTNGTYTISTGLQIEKGITLKSVEGRDVTVIMGKNTFRLLRIGHQDAEVRGFTLAKGRVAKDLTGGGVLIDSAGGALIECRITDCNSTGTTPDKGVALTQLAGRTSRCLIDGNRGDYGTSGTIYLVGGVVDNCIITGNKLHNDGGGIYIEGGEARNCTVVGNRASGKGSGVFLASSGGVLYNSIVWGSRNDNNAQVSTLDIYGATSLNVLNCCSPEGLGGNAVADHPLFLDEEELDFRLQPASACIDAGLAAAQDSAYDFNGDARVIGGEIDIGAHEFDTSQFSCGFAAEPRHGLAPLQTTIVPALFGATSDTATLDFVWRITGGGGSISVTNKGPTSLTRTFDAGRYTIELEVYDPLLDTKAVFTDTAALVSVPDTIYVVDSNPGAGIPYDSWHNAAATLHEALDFACDGATVVVSNGTYLIDRQLDVVRGITLRSHEGYEKTVIKAPKVSGIRVMQIDNAQAVVDGFTLTGGIGGVGVSGGGVLLGPAGGLLIRSRVTGNSFNTYGTSGGGLYIAAGRVANCIIDDNLANKDSGKGCGVNQVGGILENSLIATNRTYSINQCQGGGVYLSSPGILRNCTIVGNSAKLGGGVYRNSGTIINCIIVDNQTGGDTGAGAPNWYGAHATAWQNNCTPAAVGVGSITVDPLFVDSIAGNYRLRLGSPCIDAGATVVDITETELDGLPRVIGDVIDVGAYEYDSRLMSVGFTANPAKAIGQAEVELNASYFGFDAETNNLEFAWVFDDQQGTPTTTGMGLSTVRHTFDRLGRYNVRLTISDLATQKSATKVITNAVWIAPETLYLVEENANAQAPFDSPEKAGTNIHTVLSEAVGGSMILVDDGVYDVAHSIELSEGIVIRGINGMDRTAFLGPNIVGVTVVRLSHPEAMVEGMRISGGYSVSSGVSGGVVISVGGGTLSRCLITGNSASAYSRGGGVHQSGGLVTGCVISNNTVAGGSSGGGIYIAEGICENTLITASRAEFGGGVRMVGGVLRNCTITGNTGTSSGVGGAGGVYCEDGQVINCIIWGNNAVNTEVEGYPDWSGVNDGSWQHNCTAVAVGEGGVVGDPLFRNADQDDYRIVQGSPCKDTGLYQPWMDNAIDLWGNPRLDVKTYVDIGAHENQDSMATLIILR